MLLLCNAQIAPPFFRSEVRTNLKNLQLIFWGTAKELRFFDSVEYD